MDTKHPANGIVKAIVEWVMNEEALPRTVLTEEELVAFYKQFKPIEVPEHNPESAFRQMLHNTVDALRHIGVLPIDGLKTESTSIPDGEGVDEGAEGGAEDSTRE